jgi:hypothetical protein
MLGGGLPSAEQSMRAPVSFAKSTRDGGSFRNAGPTKDAATVDIGTTAVQQMKCKYLFVVISYSKTRLTFKQNVT